MQSSLVTDALKMAWFRRQPAPGLIFHSDRGSQYFGHEFQDTLAGYKMKSIKAYPKNGEQVVKIAVYPALIPDIFPAFDLTVNGSPCTPLQSKSLIYKRKSR
jgi:hypothetical protein